MPALEIEYRNAVLRVETDGLKSAHLWINNIPRANATLSERPGILRISSSVQTDYEWHEFIEAIVAIGNEETSISLRASDAEIAFETFDVQNR